jgi:hypothetical protein
MLTSVLGGTDFGECHSQLHPLCEYVFAPVQSPIEVLPEILGIFLMRKMYIIYMDLGQISLHVVNVTWTDMNSLAFINHFFKHFCIAPRLVSSFCEPVPAIVVFVDSVEVCRSAV